jgi:hypothetical protein
MSGFLIKRGRRLGREVKRYYMLDEAHLFYATNDRTPKPKRRIPVASISSIKETTGNIFEINIRNQKRPVVLHASTENEKFEWIHAIEKVISLPSTA